MASMTPPCAIPGGVGSRIRIVLGETGSDYLLLLNEDDGDRKWQSHYWHGIPSAVARQLNNCTAKGRHVTQIDFEPTSGAWFMSGQKRDGSGRHCWWGSTAAASTLSEYFASHDVVKASFGTDDYGNETYAIVADANGRGKGISNNLLTRMRRINNRGKTIYFVRLFHDGGYFISDSEGTEWDGLGIHLSNELKSDRGGIVQDVAVAGDGSWVVIRDDKYISSRNISPDVADYLSEFSSNQKTRQRNRQVQIQQYHERVRREAEQQQEAAERARIEQEAAQAAERERVEREARVMAAARAVREARAAAVARAEREAFQAAAAARKEAAMQEALLAAHLQELAREEEDIRLLEDNLNQRKRLFRASYESLPLSKRPQLKTGAAASICASPAASLDITSTSSVTVDDCVVCQDRKAAHAVVPCGHHCLCDECAVNLVATAAGSRRCPLCRTHVQSTLKIYM
jgi:Zinc finger, C3HC4 type (RING finger)